LGANSLTANIVIWSELLVNDTDLGDLGFILTDESSMQLLPKIEVDTVYIPKGQNRFLRTRYKTRDLSAKLNVAMETESEVIDLIDILNERLFSTDRSIRTEPLISRTLSISTPKIKYESQFECYEIEASMKTRFPYCLAESVSVDVASGESIPITGLITPVSIFCLGPAVNPIITIGDYTIQINTTLVAGEVIEISSLAMTAVMYDVADEQTEVLDLVTGSLPMLHPGSNLVTYDSGSLIIQYKERVLI